uniref:Uncharacterized protein n=2 Tax=Physcomitrium patens TaxID=3218 RepID=A0A7I3ZSD7_PHYPA
MTECKGFFNNCNFSQAMSRYSRLPTVGSGTSEERVRYTPSNSAQATFKLEGVREKKSCHSTGNGNIYNGVPRHRRGNSASGISVKRLREGQLMDKHSADVSMPEHFLGTALEDLDDIERQTWQKHWADALMKVQSLRHSGAGTRSERWYGIGTDIYRSAPVTSLDAHLTSSARKSNAHAASLNYWNYYPGPSVHREIPTSQIDTTIEGNDTVDFDARKNSLVDGAVPKRDGKKNRGGTPGRGAKTVTKTENADSPLETLKRSILSDNGYEVRQGRASIDHVPENCIPQVKNKASNTGCSSNSTSFKQFSDSQIPKLHSALGGRVQRTQSHRYGRLSGQKPDPSPLFDVIDNNSGTHQNETAPNSMLKKAISMREGGAHADAVMEMAQVYADSMCGVPKTLDCASCGRNLGIIVQGNPGVDLAFCQACRPTSSQWKKPILDNAAGFKKKKNGIMQFCRKMLRLEQKSI